MIKSEVYKKGEYRHDMCGQTLPQQVFITEDDISQGTCERLVNYATDRIKQAGLGFILNWNCVVSTLDQDLLPPDRVYCVNWTNEQGTRISVDGILTRKGWPSLDHGISIAENQ